MIPDLLFNFLLCLYIFGLFLPFEIDRQGITLILLINILAGPIGQWPFNTLQFATISTYAPSTVILQSHSESQVDVWLIYSASTIEEAFFAETEGSRWQNFGHGWLAIEGGEF